LSLTLVSKRVHNNIPGVPAGAQYLPLPLEALTLRASLAGHKTMDAHFLFHKDGKFIIFHGILFIVELIFKFSQNSSP
jgi:hypothetical protein